MTFPITRALRLVVLVPVLLAGASCASDLGTAAGAQALVDHSVKEFGGLDILVSAPDRFVAASLAETTDSELAATLVADGAGLIGDVSI